MVFLSCCRKYIQQSLFQQLGTEVYEHLVNTDKFSTKQGILKEVLTQLLDADPEKVFYFSTDYPSYMNEWIDEEAKKEAADFLQTYLQEKFVTIIDKIIDGVPKNDDNLPFQPWFELFLKKFKFKVNR